MRVFFDTNILLDIIEQRIPHFQSSKAALIACGQRGDEMFLAWHSLSNAFYIYERKVGAAKAQEALKDALNYLTIVSVGHQDAIRAFELDFPDLEDAMQAAAAEALAADWIISRDPKGFSRSSVPVLSPAEFVAL